MKVFEHSGYAVAFDSANVSVSLIPLTESEAMTGDDEIVKQTLENLEQRFDRKECHYSHVSKEPAPDFSNDVSREDALPALDRLTLNICNVCNMSCEYCYASHGDYYAAGLLMDKNTALAAMNHVSRAYSRIRHINFFGGEPTLNEPIIELVCEYCLYLHRKGVLSHLPRFGITTNGYNISGRMYDMLEAYDFSVSVSLDGPPAIHDQLRKTRTEAQTYNAVAANIRRLIDMGIQPEFECTYTGRHFEHDVDLVSLMDFFHETFGSKTLHCPIVTAEPRSPWFIPLNDCLALHTDAIRYSLRNLANGVPKSISVATRLLNCLTDGTPICHYCPAGQSTITINADGNIYACFMLMQDASHRIGDISVDSTDAGTSGIIESLVAKADKTRNAACLACWAQPLCFGCIGDDMRRYDNHIIRSENPGESEICDYKRSLYEVFLKSLAECCVG